MRSCRIYESEELQELLGPALRPGGFALTEKAADFCGMTAESRVLDLGCGRGATAAYLTEKHRIRAVGLDPSEKLIRQAADACSNAEFITGRGEQLPFENGCFDVVLAECTLSLMDDLDGVLKEVFRVLKDGGCFAVTDVYAREPAHANEIGKYLTDGCMRGLHELPRLEAALEGLGFKIELVEDQSRLLMELTAKMIFACGSAADFWKAAEGSCTDGQGFQNTLKKCRPGYFMMIVRKEV